MPSLFDETPPIPSSNSKKATLFCDGGSRGNPGIAGAGAIIFDENKKEIARRGKFCGRTTNNVAEYTGLIIGMELALAQGIFELEALLDSKLVVEQMKGNWKVKHPGLKPLFEKAKSLEEKFSAINFKHIPREKNHAADRIANQVMDRGR